MKLRRLISTVALLGFAGTLAAQEAVRFIGCPLYRDTDAGRKSGCWLVDDPASGRRFDLQQGHTKPQLGHEVLVEGVLPAATGAAGADNAADTRDCGGRVLQQPRVSVLPGRCPAVTLPAEGHPGKAFVLPGTVMTANHLPQPLPAPPFRPSTAHIRFDHGDDYLLYQHAEVLLQDAVRLARLSGTRRIDVTGHAATQPQSVSGRLLAEAPALAEARARMVEEALVRLGWPRSQVQRRVQLDPPAPPGTPPALVAASQRRVTLTVPVMPAGPAASAAATPASAPPVFAQAASPDWVPHDSPVGSGPFPAVMEMVPGLPQHTVYRPADLQAPGLRPLPVVAWGNGACVNVGNRFRWFLSEIASHGFVVVAAGPIGPREAEQLSGGGNLRGRPAPGSPAALAAAATGASSATASLPPGLGRAETTPAQLLQALDWAAAANSRVGSPWQGRLDTRRVAVMGQSCGGLQAIAAAADPRVTTLGVWNSGALDDSTLAHTIAGAPVTKAMVEALRLPMLYVTGEPSDVAFKNAADDVRRIVQVGRAPVFHAWREQTGHGGTYREPQGGAFGAVAADWLKWRLQGDARAARRFEGADCGLCRSPEWHVQKKDIP